MTSHAKANMKAMGVAEEEEEEQQAAPQGCCGICKRRLGSLAGTQNTSVIKELVKLENSITAPTGPPPPWIKTTQGDSVFGVVIIINSVMIGVDVDLTAPTHPDVKQNTQIMWFIETVFLIIFFAEMVLRIRADSFKKYIKDPWGIFDFSVTWMGAIDAWLLTPLMGGNEAMASVSVLRTLRLIRLVRLVRVFRMFNELVLLIRVMVSSFRALWWMCFLLVIVLYASAVLLVVTIGAKHKDENEDVDLFFGSVIRAMFWQLCVVTGEGWVAICDLTMQYNEAWLIYWIFMMILLNFSVLNLMVGLIVSRIMRLATEDDEALTNFVADSKQFKSTMMTLFVKSDWDDSGLLDKEEMKRLLEMQQTRDVLETFGVKADLPTAFLLQMLGFDDYEVEPGQPAPAQTFEDVFEACKRLCGSKSDLRSFFLQSEIHTGHVKTRKKLSSLERKLAPYLGDVDSIKDHDYAAPSSNPPRQPPSNPPREKNASQTESIFKQQRTDQTSPAAAPARPKVEQRPQQPSPPLPPPPANAPPVLVGSNQFVGEGCYEDHLEQMQTTLGTMTSLEQRQEQVIQAVEKLRQMSANATAAAQAASKGQFNGNGFPPSPVKAKSAWGEQVMQPALSLDAPGMSNGHH